jgi:hypothetical protein
MVPPWVPELPATGADLTETNDQPGSDQAAPNGASSDGSSAAASAVIPIAPARHLSATRRSIGGFFHDGDPNKMRRGIAQYVRKGYGGKEIAVRRLGGTIRTAGALYNALAPVSDRLPGAPGGALDRELLVGKSAREVIRAVIEVVRPVDGTLDSEASRMALADALSELLDRFPEANLLDLSDEERRFVVERYVSRDVFRRYQLVIGQAVLEKAPTAAAAVQRLKQVREYVREVVAASFRRLFDAGVMLTNGKITQIVRTALHDAMEVFELEPA